jgi:hypothetical protein
MSIFCYTKYVIICALAVMLWFPAHASELALDDIADYQQLFEHMEDTARDAEISPLTRRCTWFDRGTFMAVSPACFLQENLPSLAYEDVLPTLTPWIEDVSAVYDTQADAFWYQGANVEWKDDLVTLDDWPVV